MSARGAQPGLQGPGVAPPRPACLPCSVKGKQSALRSPFGVNVLEGSGTSWKHQEAGRCGAGLSGGPCSPMVCGRKGRASFQVPKGLPVKGSGPGVIV